MPELINNLQANTVYWRECADEQIKQPMLKSTTPSTVVVPVMACETKERNDSIFEVNENEIDM